MEEEGKKSCGSVHRGQGSEDQQKSRPSLQPPSEGFFREKPLTAGFFPSPQVWTFGDTTLSSGSSGRFSVQTVATDHGVVSSLVLSETLAQDFQLRYNCTAWNRFGTGTALVTLREQGRDRCRGGGGVSIINPVIRW